MLDAVVEVTALDSWRVHSDVAASVDALLDGSKAHVQVPTFCVFWLATHAVLNALLQTGNQLCWLPSHGDKPQRELA